MRIHLHFGKLYGENATECQKGGEEGVGVAARVGLWPRSLSKCENLHFYVLIYLTDRPLKQPSINRRHCRYE